MAFYKILSAAAFLFVCEFSTAQTGLQDTTRANNLYRKAETLLQEAQYDRSASFLKEAATIYKSHSQWSRLTDCYNLLSENNWRQGAFDKSLDYAEKALGVCNAQGVSDYVVSRANNNMGQSLFGQGQYKNAQDHYQLAIKQMQNVGEDQQQDIALIYSNIARVSYVMGDLEGAANYLRKGLAIVEEYFGKGHLKTSFYLNNIGNIYYAKGDYYRALDLYEKAVKIKVQHLGVHPGVANSYGNIAGINQVLKNYEVSLTYYKKALNILLEVFDEKHPQVAETYYGIGGTYLELGKYELALKNSEKALGLVEEVYGDRHLDVATKKHNLSLIYSKMGDYKKANRYCKEALEITNQSVGESNPLTGKIYNTLATISLDQSDWKEAKKEADNALQINLQTHGEKHPEVAKSYNIKAEAYKKLGEYEVALENLRLAVNANNNSLNSGFQAKSAVRSTFDPAKLLTSITSLAECYKLLYESGENKEHIELAIKNYKIADTISSTIQKTHIMVNDQMAFSKVLVSIFEGAIDANKIMYDITGKQKYIEQMFYYSERNKSSILRNLIHNAATAKFSGVPDSLLRQEEKLKMEILSYKSLMQRELKSTKRDSAGIEEIESKLFSLNHNYEILQNEFKVKYPQYYSLKYSHDETTVGGIQQLIDGNSTLLEYFEGDKFLYIFVLTHNELQFISQPKPEDFEPVIDSFRLGVEQQKFDLYTKSAVKLYDWLVKPVEKYIMGDKITVVPDGALWYLNFDLLLASGADDNTYKSLDYLLKKVAISYSYSAEMLSRKARADISQPSLLAFSYGEKQQSEPVALSKLRNKKAEDLPGTRAEIRAVSDVFDGKYYYGDKASEAAFKNNSRNYSIIHLALHGEIDDKYPNNSKLVFTHEKDTVEDGYLYAYELYGMKINADLAVLSACNTNSGEIIRGEGIMSIGRAFTYAGCGSLLLTQWQVSDATTPVIMKDFYTGLKKGLGKDVALREAKLKFLEHSDNLTEAPFYWGSFVLMGNTSSLKTEEGYSRWLLVTSLLIFLTVGVVIIKKTAFK